MADYHSIPWSLIGLTSFLLYFTGSGLKKYQATKAKRSLYPPGPKGYPIIGNLLDVPKINPWITYTEMSKKYGDMVFLRVFSQPILILCSSRRISDLFDKRSASYSGRFQTMMTCIMLDLGSLFPLINYGPKWRKHRRMFHQHFNPSVLPQYHPLITRHVQKFLVHILDTPKDFAKHTELLIGGTLLNIGYGFAPESRTDPFVSEAREVADAFKVSGIPGTFLVDTIPLLNYLPSWFPGAGFKSWAAIYRAKNDHSKDAPYEVVMNAMKRNEAEPCVLTKLIEELPSPNDPSYAQEVSDVKNVVGVSYLAGTDTTNAVSIAFFLLMAMHPECQQKAHEELDRVVGPGVLPEFEQISGLVYMKALVTELLRWFVVFPLALPHMTTEDDYYDGYFIPNGTIVMGNAWAILHDPEVFEDLEEFKPERYIKDGQFNSDLLNPNDYAFGYGRRVCPGRELSMDIFYMMATSTLAMFDILPPKDAAGNPIKLEASFDDGIFLNATPFECIIQPRSSATEGAIRSLLD